MISRWVRPSSKARAESVFRVAGRAGNVIFGQVEVFDGLPD